MLLRAGGTQDVEIEVVAGADGDGGVPHGGLLVAFTEAVLGRGGDVAAARRALAAAAGEAAVVEAAAVVAMFSTNDRIADATGTPLDHHGYKARRAIAAELGLEPSEPL